MRGAFSRKSGQSGGRERERRKIKNSKEGKKSECSGRGRVGEEGRRGCKIFTRESESTGDRKKEKKKKKKKKKEKKEEHSHLQEESERGF